MEEQQKIKGAGFVGASFQVYFVCTLTFK
jgi:hypothetical protein